MSTAAYSATDQQPIRMPPELSSTLAAWWMAIGFALFGILAVWPMVLDAAPQLVPAREPDALRRLGWIMFAIVVAAIVLVGAVLSVFIARQRKNAMRLFKLANLVGVVFWIGVIACFVYLTLGVDDPVIAFGKGSEQHRGLVPFLTIILLATIAILPFGFGILAFSYSGTDAVKEYFEPPPPPEEPTYAPEESAVESEGGEPPPEEEPSDIDVTAEVPIRDPSEAASQAVQGGGAGDEQVALDELPNPEDEGSAVALGTPQSETRLVPAGKETQLRPPRSDRETTLGSPDESSESLEVTEEVDVSSLEDRRKEDSVEDTVFLENEDAGSDEEADKDKSN